jgi:hypothetical protein
LQEGRREGRTEGRKECRGGKEACWEGGRRGEREREERANIIHTYLIAPSKFFIIDPNKNIARHYSP